MADYSTPVKNQEFKFDVVLYSQATGQVLANPTLASGDVKLWDTGDADWTTNITTLPSVSPTGSARVTVTVSAAEMDNEEVAIKFSDASGAEWHDLYIFLSPQDAGAGGTVDANLIQVDGVALADATLTLKKLVVSNSAGNAVEFTSTGSNGTGLQVTGHGSGYGTRIFAGATGVGLGVSGGATSGGGVVVTTTSGVGVNLTSDDNAGLYVGSLATHAVQFIGTGTGAGLRVEGGATGNGITTVSGGTSGYGMSVSGLTGDIDGNLVGTIGGLTNAALAQFFTVNSSETFGSAVSGSVVKEIVDNAKNTASEIAAGVWDAARTSYVVAGSFGEGITVESYTSNGATYIKSEADQALVDIGLDHLVSASVAGADVADDSIFAKLVSKSATADWDTFVNTTDALEAIRDRGDSSWTTATGFSTHSAADVVTAMGTGTFLTAIPWNAAWDTEVESEVQDAIEANHLDHLLATTYDPASKPGASDALLNELIEDDMGVSRYTANALEQAPSGGGGDATAANQTTIINHLTDIKGATWSSGTDTLEAIRDRGDSAWTTATGFSTHSAADVISAMGTGTFLTAIPWNAAWDTEVQSEVNDGLVAIGLDHLVFTSVVGADIADDSIVAKMVSKSATADWDTFVPGTDSLEALYDALAALAPLSNTADAFTQTTGTVISGTYTDTYTDNATRHVLAPNGGAVIDAYYDFNVGTGRAPISVAINGYWQGTGFAYVWVYDHVDEAWVDLSGTGNRMPSRTSDANYSMALSREHISDAGLVQIRFTTTSTTGTDRLRIDRLLVYSITDAGANLLTPQMIWEYNNRDINSIAGSEDAATNLKNQALTVISGIVVADGSNSATSFKTNLTGADNFYGDSNGGGALVFITGANAGKAIRVSGFVNSTDFITVESAFPSTPSADDEFIVLGRIEV